MTSEQIRVGVRILRNKLGRHADGLADSDLEQLVAQIAGVFADPVVDRARELACPHMLGNWDESVQAWRCRICGFICLTYKQAVALESKELAAVAARRFIR